LSKLTHFFYLIKAPHPGRVARWFGLKPKIQIWVNFGGSCNGIFYGHLVHFTVFCYILWRFGIVRVNLVYFSHFGILYQEKSGNPATRRIVCTLTGDINFAPALIRHGSLVRSRLRLLPGASQAASQAASLPA
jgi:hypothetical protein